MNSDNSEGPVFRDTPSNRSDRTIIRPMPGGRGAAAGQRPDVRQAAQVAPRASDASSHQRTYQPRDLGEFRTHSGLNPLVNAAAVLIAVYRSLLQSTSHPDVGGLHQHLVSEIKNFEGRAKHQNISPEIILAGRYVLCTALDEAVLSTPWGAESAWTQRTLLSIFHNEAHGGEKFYQILDRMRDRPAESMDMIELQYLLLSLGFEGRYRVIQRGREKIEQLRDELFNLIRAYRGSFERDLSPSWQGLGRVRNTLSHYVPMWVVVVIVAGTLVLGYSGFRYWLFQSSSQVVQSLNALAGADSRTVRSEETPQ